MIEATALDKELIKELKKGLEEFGGKDLQKLYSFEVGGEGAKAYLQLFFCRTWRDKIEADIKKAYGGEVAELFTREYFYTAYLNLEKYKGMRKAENIINATAKIISKHLDPLVKVYGIIFAGHKISINGILEFYGKDGVEFLFEGDKFATYVCAYLKKINRDYLSEVVEIAFEGLLKESR
jgi:hypothetical protein